jgi:hypothetical protein
MGMQVKTSVQLTVEKREDQFEIVRYLELKNSMPPDPPQFGPCTAAPTPSRPRVSEVNTRNDVLIATVVRPQNQADASRRLRRTFSWRHAINPHSADKPDRFFTVIKFWMDETSGVALALKIGVPTYQVEDEEGRTDLLIHLPIEKHNNRWYLWRPDHAGFDSKSIFEGALIEE